MAWSLVQLHSRSQGSQRHHEVHLGQKPLPAQLTVNGRFSSSRAVGQSQAPGSGHVTLPYGGFTAWQLALSEGESEKKEREVKMAVRLL